MLGSFKMQRETSEPVMPSRPVSALFFSSLKGKVLIRKKKVTYMEIRNVTEKLVKNNVLKSIHPSEEE